VNARLLVCYRQAGSIERLTVLRRPYGAADLILRLTQDCVRWRELVLGSHRWLLRGRVAGVLFPWQMTNMDVTYSEVTSR
jgi:hypothetical protein